MNFKLDENFGPRTQHVFQAYGHDVQTVRMLYLMTSFSVVQVFYFESCATRACS